MAVAKRGSCPCGAVQLEASQLPPVRFYCHCSTCQALYRRPYVDLTVAWSRHVKITVGADRVQWVRRHILPASVHRGLCPECKGPVLGRLQFPIPGVTFVVSSNWSDDDGLATPAGHGFYHRRVAEVDDGLPKVSGLIRSMLSYTAWMVPGLLRGPTAR